MNPDIATLSRRPRGKAWRSRLIPHVADIWRWRAAGATYRQIALNLKERDLYISAAAVHDFVRVRDSRGAKGPYALPQPAVSMPSESVVQPVHTSDHREISPESTGTRSAPPGTQRKKIVFAGLSKPRREFAADDPCLNDPLS